jgi:hypothetical protein
MANTNRPPAYFGGPPKTDWELFLDRHFCQAHYYTGNRPCDDGVMCDRCRTPRAEAQYKQFKAKLELSNLEKED